MTIRSQVLAYSKLPSMNQVFSLFIQEEKQKVNFREKISRNSTTLYTKKNEKEEKNDEPKKKGVCSKNGKKLDTNFYCDNCKYFGHLREDCYHIVDFPKKNKNNSKKAKDSANQATTSTNMPNLSNEELLLLKDLLNKSSGIYVFFLKYFKL